MKLNCYCCSSLSYEECCEPYLKEIKTAETAVVLMRSRYSAYATQHVDYLVVTTHSSTRKLHSKRAILDWSQSNQWIKLEVLNATTTTVEFKAYFLDSDHQMQIHHEFSAFKEENGIWFYVDGTFH
ncbi:YchJ family protein [Flavobacterium sp. WC2430]|uniref:YchJ family protein n=1 Tax=Flavobacterium sp. WC2430 TaxID=3234137 RepID=UPI0034660B1C